jgi:hypothetical protein
MNTIDGGPGGRPRVAISTSLLGRPVRFDGGHERAPFCSDRLAPHIEWVPVCPEAESGMPVPLDGIVLEKDAPSCGLQRDLPVIDEGRLHDPGLRECFLHQVFTHHRLRTLAHSVLQLVDGFRAGLHALGVPLALLAHHVWRSGLDGWLARQVYFQPFPRALSPFTVA